MCGVDVGNELSLFWRCHRWSPVVKHSMVAHVPSPPIHTLTMHPHLALTVTPIIISIYPYHSLDPSLPHLHHPLNYPSLPHPHQLYLPLLPHPHHPPLTTSPSPSPPTYCYPSLPHPHPHPHHAPTYCTLSLYYLTTHLLLPLTTTRSSPTYP